MSQLFLPTETFIREIYTDTFESRWSWVTYFVDSGSIIDARAEAQTPLRFNSLHCARRRSPRCLLIRFLSDRSQDVRLVSRCSQNVTFIVAWSEVSKQATGCGYREWGYLFRCDFVGIVRGKLASCTCSRREISLTPRMSDQLQSVIFVHLASMASDDCRWMNS
jgi:hypothetical protein